MNISGHEDENQNFVYCFLPLMLFFYPWKEAFVLETMTVISNAIINLHMPVATPKHSFQNLTSSCMSGTEAFF